jgi:hypothetical protein
MANFQNTLYTSNPDVGCNLKPPVASIMTLQHHSGSDLRSISPQKTKPTPHLHRPDSVRVNPYMLIHTIPSFQHTLYISNLDVRCSLKPPLASIMTVHSSLGLRSTPKTPKFTPDLHRHRPNSLRVDPYGHSHHIKVPKHFVHIQYGCGVQSEASCSLNHDITTSLGLRSTLLKDQTFAPHLPRCKSVRVDPYGHSHHTKLPTHFVYIQYGCPMQSEASSSLNITRAQIYPQNPQIHPRPAQA